MTSAPAVLDDRLRRALVESRQRYKDLIEICSDFVWETNNEGRFIFVSPRGALGYLPADLLERPASAFLVETGAAPVASPFDARREINDVEIWFRRADGGEACLRVSARPLLEADGRWTGARGACRDVTVEMARDSALARANTRERLLAHIMQVMRDTPDPRDMLDLAATATARAMGASECDILRVEMDGASSRAATFSATAGSRGGEIGARIAITDVAEGGLADGTAEPAIVEAGATSLLVAVSRHRGAINGYLRLWRSRTRPWSEAEVDLTAAVADRLGIAHEHIRQHIALERASRTDALTGLMNRRAFNEGLATRIAHSRRTGRPGALIYVDLDNFKLINDRGGHEAGDTILCEVADLLAAGNRAADLAVRLGGDEFALWLEETGAKGARAKADSLLAAGRDLAGHSGDAARPFGFSLGIAMYDPAAGETQEALLARADAAMYAAKSGGKGGGVLADPPRDTGGEGKP
ncbi:MAG: sensor domain-containing diguanylate cyclase [Alphaproteobacteria bacterium]